jgi:hypothetical protein
MNDQPAPSDSAQGRKGIVVLGTPRSGTTLLRRILDAHPNLNCPGETSLLSACARFLRTDTIAAGAEVGVLPGLAQAGIPREETLARLRDFVFGVYEELAARAGKKRWAEKTAFDAFYIDQIEQLLGDRVAYVCLVRNGVDFTCSMQELCDKNGGYLPEVHEYVKRFERPLVAFAHCWSDLTGRILRFVAEHEGNAHLIRYEDLVHRPGDTVSGLLAFLDEPDRDELIDEALNETGSLGLGDWKTYSRKTIDASSVGRGASLSSFMRNALGDVMNPRLIECGYDPVQIQASDQDASVDRRYQLSLMVERLKGDLAD